MISDITYYKVSKPLSLYPNLVDSHRGKSLRKVLVLDEKGKKFHTFIALSAKKFKKFYNIYIAETNQSYLPAYGGALLLDPPRRWWWGDGWLSGGDGRQSGRSSAQQKWVVECACERVSCHDQRYYRGSDITVGRGPALAALWHQCVSIFTHWRIA